MKSHLLPLFSVAVLLIAFASVGCMSTPGPDQKQAQGSSSNTAPQFSITVAVNVPSGGGSIGAKPTGESPAISVMNTSSPAAAPNAAASVESKQDAKGDLKVDPKAVGEGAAKVITAAGDATTGGAAGVVKTITGEGDVKVEPAAEPKIEPKVEPAK